jgi:hypothetical protein
MCLDREGEHAPVRELLGGLARFVDLVETLGGQLHLWVAWPGDGTGCRREHPYCAAGKYVARIRERLGNIASRDGQTTGELWPWLQVLDDALARKGPATVAFAILPRMVE